MYRITRKRMEEERMVKNLTEGRPLKLLFFFALPMVMGNMFKQLYNMLD